MPIPSSKFLDRMRRTILAVEGADSSSALPEKIARDRALRAQTLFAVRVTIDGGSAGSVSATCSYTYTAKSDAGYQFGTGLSPQRRRLTNVPYTATPANSWGAGFFDKNGDFVLWDANETPQVEDPCP